MDVITPTMLISYYHEMIILTIFQPSNKNINITIHNPEQMRQIVINQKCYWYSTDIDRKKILDKYADAYEAYTQICERCSMPFDFDFTGIFYVSAKLEADDHEIEFEYHYNYIHSSNVKRTQQISRGGIHYIKLSMPNVDQHSTSLKFHSKHNISSNKLTFTDGIIQGDGEILMPFKEQILSQSHFDFSPVDTIYLPS